MEQSNETRTRYVNDDRSYVEQRSQIQLHDVPARVVVKIAVVLALVAGAIALVVLLAPFILTFAVAAFLAVAVDPAVRFLQRRGLPRGAAVALLLLVLLGVLALVVGVFVPPLVDQAQSFAKALPAYLDDVRRSSLFQRLDGRYDIVGKTTAQVQKLPTLISQQIGSVVGTVVAGLVGVLTIVFLMVFLLLGGGDGVKLAVRVWPKLAERRTWRIVQDSYAAIGGYVAGTVVISLIAGTVTVVAMYALGLPFALPIGLWMALLDAIPLVGASIGGIPSIVVAFAAGSVVDGIIMLVVQLLYQQVENIFIQPTVLGRFVSLSGLVVFVSVLVGSQLLGVLGALFAVPIAGIVTIVIREVLNAREAGNGDEPPPVVPAIDDKGEPHTAQV